MEGVRQTQISAEGISFSPTSSTARYRDVHAQFLASLPRLTRRIIVCKRWLGRRKAPETPLAADARASSQSENLHEPKAANQKSSLSTPEAPTALAKINGVFNSVAAFSATISPSSLPDGSLSYLSLFVLTVRYAIRGTIRGQLPLLLLCVFSLPFAPLFHRRPPVSRFLQLLL